MSIFDLVNAKEISTYWLGTASARIPYLGATLFPSKKQLGLDLSWIVGRKGLPAALTPSEFDVKATLRDRIGLAKIDTEMPFFREAMRIGEKERQELNKAAAAANAAFLEPIINQIYDDVGTLVQGAEVTAERMRMQLLSTGKISIVANRLNYDYDYRFSNDHKKIIGVARAKWSAVDTATPVTDIQEWQTTIEDDTGVRPTRAICTRKTWNYLLMNKSIKMDLNPAGGQNIIMTDSMLQQYLMAKLGLTVAVYNKKFSSESVATQFFPDDVFTLIPDGSLGSTYYGTTPEESDLMSGNTDAQVSIVDTGVAITTVKEPHPVNVLTIVSAIILPSFEQIDNVFIAKVA
jgi:hypothetical protein